MPSLSNLVLTDRATTPVAHTFTPREQSQGTGVVAESSGTPIGDNKVTVGLKVTSGNRYRPELKFTFPVVQTETINGIARPTVVRTSYVELKFNFDPTTSEAERNNIVGMVQSSLDASKALVNDTVVKLQSVY